jgi:tetratricopeptide (TPR) repeat protein
MAPEVEGMGTCSRAAARALGAVLLAVLACCANHGAARSRDGGAADAQFRRARELAGTDPASAIDLLERALAEWPQDDSDGKLEVRRWLVHVCALAGDPERGLHHAVAAIEGAPQDAWLRYAKGAALGELGRHGEALVAFTEALDRDPEHVKSLQHRGSVEALLGRHAAAIADFDRALAILGAKDPREVPEGKSGMLRSIRFHRADSLDALGRHAEADAERERAGSMPA